MKLFLQKIKLIGLLIIIVGEKYAQTTGKDYGFNYEFNDEKSSKHFFWTSPTFNTKRLNNFLYLSHTKKDETYFINDFAYINYQKTFTISSSFNIVTGKSQSSYGIVFGSGGGLENAYVFAISENGYYTFFKYEKDKVTDLKAWTLCSNINMDKQPNVIDIKGELGNYNFYINGKLIYTHKALPFYGFEFGYYISDETAILSDYLRVNQTQTEKINVIADAANFGKKINLGKNINTTENDEFCPVITSDERTLYLSRKKTSEFINTDNDDDIWFAEFNTKDSTWNKLKNIGKPLNNSANNFVQSVSHDNNSLITGNKYNDKGEYNGVGYSISTRTKNGWSIPKDIVIANYYNKNRYNEISLSPNGKVMLLSIERDETLGAKDLYVSFLQNDGTWDEPKNIGKTINTFADEVSPFIASDGITIYFSSAGHAGFGNNDIFMAKRLDNTWQKWSTPKNLGNKINTSNWDAYYTIPASGKNAYIVSNIEGSSDVYMLKQPESAKPDPVVLIKGIVFNSETKLPLDAIIQYSELGSNEILGHVKSNPETGAFMLSLPKGKKYSIIAEKQHFISVHDNTDLLNLKIYEEKEIDLFLTPIKTGQTVVINNLFFEGEKTNILPESFSELNRIYGILKFNEKLKIVISGHTSKNESGLEWNKTLSTNRALAVKKYLVDKGILESRITCIGYGYSKPLYSSTNQAIIVKNRRVEFEIVEH